MPHPQKQCEMRLSGSGSCHHPPVCNTGGKKARKINSALRRLPEKRLAKEINRDIVDAYLKSSATLESLIEEYYSKFGLPLAVSTLTCYRNKYRRFLVANFNLQLEEVRVRGCNKWKRDAVSHRTPIYHVVVFKLLCVYPDINIMSLVIRNDEHFCVCHRTAKYYARMYRRYIDEMLGIADYDVDGDELKRLQKNKTIYVTAIRI